MSIERFFHPSNPKEYAAVRAAQLKAHIELDFWEPHRRKLQSLVVPNKTEISCSFEDIVTIEGVFDDPTQKEHLYATLKFLLPWRKGPFRIMGIDIDSEWRSELKWKRIESYLGDVSRQRVADIGCNNGYYMFRLLSKNPECVIGFDPNGRFYYQFDLINRFVQSEKLHYELLGVEHMSLFKECFDTVLCMGVLYHRRDPVQCLQDLKECIRPGGKIILESITVPGPVDYCLFPSDRYAMMRNVWFVPTESSLLSMMRRAGFKNIELIDTTMTTVEEQRKTALAPWDSLEDFLDPKDRSKTVEGYPSPWRTIVGATVG